MLGLVLAAAAAVATPASYPQVAKYKGSGNIKDASNWSCAAPQTSTR